MLIDLTEEEAEFLLALCNRGKRLHEIMKDKNILNLSDSDLDKIDSLIDKFNGITK